MKRFTETQKWDDPWFLELEPHLKLLWLWLCDRCDHAGIIEPSLKLASFHIGYQYPNDTLSAFGDRIEEIGHGKYLLTKFIQFQYGTISRDCKAHNPVFASLEKHKVEFSERVSKGYPKGIHTLKDKDKDKDKDKNKDKSTQFQRPTAPEVAEYGITLSPPFLEAENFVDFYESKGWTVGKQPMKDWKATVRTWHRRQKNESIQGGKSLAQRAAQTVAAEKASGQYREEAF